MSDKDLANKHITFHLSLIILHQQCNSGSNDYPAPPAFKKRLSVIRNGASRYQHKTPCRDGTTYVIFESFHYRSKPASLVPKSRVRLTIEAKVSGGFGLFLTGCRDQFKSASN
ncbi:MAG: hypothetical protein DRR42_16630 [Gammaproteobacteria bacterium]|nr:MAG: hypothetical protein DRR42_16630 [Gammaproteobacteria bacterium]